MKKVIILILVTGIFCSCAKKLSDELHKKREDLKDNSEFNYLFAEGLRLKTLGNPGEALKCFKKCIKIEPGNDASYFQIAQALYDMGNIEAGKRYMLNAIKYAPGNVWYNYVMSQVYYQEGKRDSALYYMQRAERIMPHVPEIKLRLAELYNSAGKTKLANELFREIEKKYGLNERSSLIVVNSYLDGGDFTSAENTLLKLIQEYPEERIYKRILAEVYRKMNLNEKSVNICKELLELSPGDTQTILWAIDILAGVKGNDLVFSIVEDMLGNDKISDDSKITAMLKLVSNTELVKNNFNRLENKIKQLENKNIKNKAAIVLRSVLYKNYGRQQDAVKQLKQIIEDDKSNYYAWENLIWILEEIKDYDQLFKYAGDASREFNMWISAKVLYAVAAKEKGEYNIALEELRKAKIIAESQQREAITQILIVEAEVYYRMKDYEKTYKAMENALEINADNIIVLNNYAYYLAEGNGDLKKANSMAVKVLEKEPENAVYLDTFAWILYKQGKSKKAAEIFKEIIQKHNGKDPEYFEHYGYVLKKIKKCREAVEYWKKAIELDKGKEYLKKEIEKCTGKR